MKLPNCIIDSIKTLKDRSLKVSIVTRELSPQEMIDLFSSLNEEVDTVEIDVVPEEGTKTSSQRMRNCLYVLWDQEYKGKYKDFPVFYESMMERIINKIKDKLI